MKKLKIYLLKILKGITKTWKKNCEIRVFLDKKEKKWKLVKTEWNFFPFQAFRFEKPVLFKVIKLLLLFTQSRNCRGEN